MSSNPSDIGAPKAHKTGRICAVLVMIALSFSSLLVAPTEALAQDSELRPYSSLVVQNRQHIPRHELTASVGLLPLDAFTRGVTASGAYTLHFSELVGWEVAQFTYSFHYDTRLKGQLEALDIHPSPFEVMNYYISSNVVFKPLYWKGSWLNNTLRHGEWLVTAGGAYAWYTRSARPGLSLGTGMRLFAGNLLSFRLDVRYLVFPDTQFFEDLSYKDELFIGLGTSLGF